MPNQTIASLSYRLYLDSQGLTKGSRQAQADFRQLKKSEASVITETEKLENEFETLQSAVKNGVPGALNVLDKRLAATGKRMTKQGKIVDTYGSKWSNLSKSLTGVIFNLKTLGAVIAAGAIATSLKSQIQNMDQLNKSAQAAGVSVEFLSQMQFALGKTAGLTEDQVTTAFTKMGRRISEAAAGGGEAVGVIEELQLSAEKLNAMGPEKAFYRVAEAISQLTNDQDKLRISTKFFDDEQAKLFIALEEGTKAIDRQRQVGDQLGATVRQIDVDRMSTLADQFADIGASWDRFTRSFTDSFGPTMIRFMDNMSQVLEKFGGTSGTGGNVPNVNNRFSPMEDIIGGLPLLFSSEASGHPGGPFGAAMARRIQSEREEFEKYSLSRSQGGDNAGRKLDEQTRLLKAQLDAQKQANDQSSDTTRAVIRLDDKLNYGNLR